MSCEVKFTVEKKTEPSPKTENVKEKSFDELFKSISPEEITDNVFKLVGKDFTVITAGKIPEHNSMTAGWGGLGILFEKPTTWCFLRASRYTLELIKKEQTYTMSYFSDEYKEQVLFFGSKTGKNTDKMKETALTAIQTPSGNTTFKEARLIIECKLAEITTVGPDDFYTPEGKTFIESAYDEVKEYHKIVFGEITNVWINK
jgi:flavin reductase (DIM6/NTAB) family NADH-FMN oxidoreductase RutF